MATILVVPPMPVTSATSATATLEMTRLIAQLSKEVHALKEEIRQLCHPRLPSSVPRFHAATTAALGL